MDDDSVELGKSSFYGEYDENGVDLSLVRYSLSLTPTQRLKAVENFMNAMASVRRAPPLKDDSTK